MFRLSLNTGFAVNRYSEPEEWVKIVSLTGVHYAQMTADLLNPSLPDKIIKRLIAETLDACQKYDVKISSTFTGAFTRLNHLAYPDKDVQKYWVDWFKHFVDISLALGSNNMGSHFGIFTDKDNRNPNLRAERRQQNIANWHEVARYAKEKGLAYISWEPMSVSREQGETQQAALELQRDINKNSPLPFMVCLDVDHGDVSSNNPNDIDPYSWLAGFAKVSPLIHLKQSQTDKGGHYPFTKEHNEKGKIKPKKVIEILKQNGRDDADLILELSFKEREPFDSTVAEMLKESVNYWRPYVSA